MTFAVTDAASGRLLGMVGLKSADPGMREIGYWTAPWARGQGVMTAAARLTCRFGFDVLGLRGSSGGPPSATTPPAGSRRRSASPWRAPAGPACRTAASGWTAGSAGCSPGELA